MKHNPGFLRLVESQLKDVNELDIDEVWSRLKGQKDFVFLDVREESEWAQGHLPQAIHLGKGIIERDIETKIPDLNTSIVLYCGGGYRSALAAYNLQLMGYKKVFSMRGGVRGWKDKNLPMEL